MYSVYFVWLRFGLVLAFGGTWFTSWGYLVYFVLPPFWACFSLQVYLVYFVLPPFWSFRGYLVASRGTWYTSFWLRFGASGTWYTFFWLRFGSLGGTWYTSFFLRFGPVLASGGTWYTSWCIYTSFGFVLGLFLASGGTWYTSWGYLVYFVLPLFWAWFSLQGYLVYFVLPPFCSLWGYLVASRSTWYTSFWLRFGASGTWYTSFASVLGLFQPLGLLGILHFGSGLKPPVLGIYQKEGI